MFANAGPVRMWAAPVQIFNRAARRWRHLVGLISAASTAPCTVADSLEAFVNMWVALLVWH